MHKKQVIDRALKPCQQVQKLETFKDAETERHKSRLGDQVKSSKLYFLTIMFFFVCFVPATREHKQVYLFLPVSSPGKW